MENIVELSHIKKEYLIDNTGTLAVDDVSFCVPGGSFLGIMGASGSGKSTLLNLISTIDKPTSGQITIDGNDITNISENDLAKFRREHLGFIFQEYNLLDTLTLYENIALALTIKEMRKEEINDVVMSLAGRLEIENLLDKFPYQVSGGQRQRCACARALAINPQLILADEPTGALDSHSAKNLMETLSGLNQELQVTILMVTHDALSASYCNEILFMKDGKIVDSLKREKQEKRAFFLEILDRMARMAGDDDYVS